MATAEKGSPEIRQRLATVSEKLGIAELKHGTLIEVLFSIPMLYSAAEIRGDKIAQERIRKIHQFCEKLVFAGDPKIVIFSWPILPLIADASLMSAKNEIAFSQLFAGVNTPDEFLLLLKK